MLTAIPPFPRFSTLHAMCAWGFREFPFSPYHTALKAATPSTMIEFALAARRRQPPANGVGMKRDKNSREVVSAIARTAAAEGYSDGNVRAGIAPSAGAPHRHREHGVREAVRCSQRGFTLIEVLVVLGILGVIATIVILSLAGFLGSGKEESANSEAHQVQTAVIAYMSANNIDSWDGTVDKSGTTDVHSYILNTGRLQAIYTIAGGKIASATAYPDGKWSDCTWNVATRARGSAAARRHTHVWARPVDR